jgi:hypothetical protein
MTYGTSGKTYLGDGLYASYDGYQIRLWTDRGDGDIHEVYLNPATLDSLLKFMKRFFKIAVS